MTTPTKRTRWNIEATANGWIVRRGYGPIAEESVGSIHSFNSLDAMMIWLRKSIKETL